MTPSPPKLLADAYKRLLEDITDPLYAAEDYTTEEKEPILSEMEVQGLWHAGLLGNEGDTSNNLHVRVLDFGEWNHGAGPDFLRAELEIGGKRLRGDIEIDPHAQDWERHGHGSNPLYNRVALHITLTPPPLGWYTRNSLHMEIPVLHIPASRVRLALGLASPVDREVVPVCRQPLASMPIGQVASLLQAAAAHRAHCKRTRFHRKAQALGMSQAWFEALAETLGYSANKAAMITLARRAPLHLLTPAPEPILFGTAGFLVPMLPDKATDEARIYHRVAWDTWWQYKEKFSLSSGRAIPWSLTGQRPLNHPHRRIAALAACAVVWPSIESMFTAASALRLAAHLEAIHHPFWDFHCTLNSAPLSKRAALVGRSRIFDFLVNYVYVIDESPGAWDAYLNLRAYDIPAKITRTARHLFGARADITPLLRYSYAQQGLLQIQADFCSATACQDCLFPVQLKQWQH